MEKSPLLTPVVAGVVLKRDGKYLLVQEKNPSCYGKWNLPAGKVDQGDTLEQAAVREAKEETGFDVELQRKLDVYQVKATDPAKHVYVAVSVGGSLRVPKDELLDVRWFSLEEIRQLSADGELRDPFVLESIMESEGDKLARLKAGVDYTGVTISFCCHDGQGNFLLHKRSQKCRDERGAWDFGGGKLEFGETFEEGVRREIREEYGCECELGEQIAVYTRNRVNHDGRPTHWVGLAYSAKVDPSQVVIGEPESMDELGWFKLDQLPEPLHTSWRMLLDEMPEKFASL